MPVGKKDSSTAGAGSLPAGPAAAVLRVDDVFREAKAVRSAACDAWGSGDGAISEINSYIANYALDPGYETLRDLWSCLGETRAALAKATS